MILQHLGRFRQRRGRMYDTTVTFRSATVLILFCLNCFVAAGQSTPARRVSFNEGWRFHKGDAPGAQGTSFDDSGWRRLALPHDWAIEGPFAVQNSTIT